MKRQSKGPGSGKNSGKKSGGRVNPAKKYGDDSRSGTGKYNREEKGSYRGKTDKKTNDRGERPERPKYDRREGSSSRSERGERSERPERRSGRDDRSSYREKSDRKPYERKERSDRPNYDRREGSSSRSERGERSERPERRSGKDDRSSYREKSDRKPYERKERSDRPNYNRREGSSSRSERGERSERPERRSGKDDRSSYREKSDRKPYERKERSERPKFDRSESRANDKKTERRDEEKPKRPRTKKSDAEQEPYLKKEFREDDHFSFNKYKKEKKNLARSAEDYNKLVKNSSKKKDAPRKDDGTVRLNKFIANAGVCSRREADELIQTGVIKVNGKIVTELGTRILPTDKVQYGDQTLSQEKMVYVLLNKPKDYITTTDDPEKRRTVMELVKNASKERIYPVGRLDRNTTGILLFTNDGELAKKLTHPKYNVKKIYHVMTDQNVSAEDIQKLRDGFELEDGYVKTDDVQFVGDASNKKDIGVEIHSGRNRIVRRMFEHLGYNVVKLDRVMFAGLTKKDLPRGKWRFLTASEVTFLKNL